MSRPPENSKTAKPDSTPQRKDQPTLKEVEPIRGPRGQEVRQKSDLVRLVEKPLLGACELLFDKGIKTDFTSANPRFKHAVLSVEAESLTEENLEIALKMGGQLEDRMSEGKIAGKSVVFRMPITEDTLQIKVEQWAASIALAFNDQRTAR